MNKSFFEEKQNFVIDAQSNYLAALGDNKIAPKGFIYISKMKKNDDNQEDNDRSELYLQKKLKFHISLPEQHRDLYEQGWEIIKNCLIENEARSFKVVHSDVCLSLVTNGSQQGKEVTIHTHSDLDKNLNDWQIILQKITDSLIEAKIPPGYSCLTFGDRADNPVKGSTYISYRYEKELSSGEKDPCVALEIVEKMNLEMPFYKQAPNQENRTEAVAVNKQSRLYQPAQTEQDHLLDDDNSVNSCCRCC